MVLLSVTGVPVDADKYEALAEGIVLKSIGLLYEATWKVLIYSRSNAMGRWNGCERNGKELRIRRRRHSAVTYSLCK